MEKLSVGLVAMLVVALGNAEMAAQAESSRKRLLPLAAVRSRCIEFSELQRPDFRECQVSEFGEFGSVDGETYYYATYCLIPTDTTMKGSCGPESFTGRYFHARALAVFVGPPASANVRLLFERADSEIGVLVYPHKPEIVRAAAGTLLYLPIAVDGTGMSNSSEYYLRERGKWAPIDAEKWVRELEHRIPAGLLIRKGVWPDLHTMQADVGLYRPGDANCCPTGGTARVRIAIRSKRIVIDSIAIEESR